MDVGYVANRWVHGICYLATGGAIAGAISERDVIEWTGVVIAVGSSLFAFGWGQYHSYRKQRREEDHEDRVRMLEDVQAHTRILCEMENRQQVLQKSMEELTLFTEKVRCRFPNADGSARCCDENARKP